MEETAGKIQNSELEVMRVLWRAGGTLPLAEIRQALAEERGWDDSTTKTLYGGSAKRLVAALVSDGSLSEEDVAELSAMFRVADDE